MVNTQKLRTKMADNNMNVRALAKAIGINAATMYRKLNKNCNTVTIEEAEKIIDILNLTNEEIKDIFFAENVA